MEEVRLYEMYLTEAIEERKTDLLNRNNEYKKSRKKLDEIFNEYPNLQYILEENERLILNETECKILQKLITIHMDIRDFEEKEIFLLGGKEMFLYLKDVGLIKESIFKKLERGVKEMAVIKIKTIKSNLQAVINYGKNGDKTDNGILVSSVNCSVDTAYEEMALTKKFFHKEDKTLGYHIIQFFKGNEVSPSMANQIGIELAQELWGDKYQIIVCTHINKENIHNHLILNSVSFIDGKKYHNGKEDIFF